MPCFKSVFNYKIWIEFTQQTDPSKDVLPNKNAAGDLKF